MWRGLVNASPAACKNVLLSLGPSNGPKSERKRRNKMNDSNRVLTRAGAREMTAEEVDFVSGGGPFHTNVITFNITTGQRDGDGYTLES
jgi:hypothetical protein